MLRRFCFQAQKHLGLSLRPLVAIPMPQFNTVTLQAKCLFFSQSFAGEISEYSRKDDIAEGLNLGYECTWRRK